MYPKNQWWDSTQVADALLREEWVGHASYEAPLDDIADAFATFAAYVTARPSIPATIGAFVERCLDEAAVMGSVSRAVAEGSPPSRQAPLKRAMTVVQPDLANCF